MKPILSCCLIAWISVVILTAPWRVSKCFAMDDGGCLTCHQYPGLVSPEATEGFKVFHIDEERYAASPHGRIDCRECHTTIHKVPHVGETSTNCTNGCHAAAKERELVEAYDPKTMHAGEKSYITGLSDASSCRECHGLYPHRSNRLARAFINMHVGFMTCETCHINRDKFKSLTFDWASSETADFAGRPFGTRFNPKIEEGSESAHFISRIAVFSEVNGEKQSMTNTWDVQKAREYLGRENRLNRGEKKKQMAYFHRDLHEMEISVTCNECHSQHGILDFGELGFSEKKERDLIYLNIKGLVTKYKTFYLPDLFRE